MHKSIPKDTIVNFATNFKNKHLLNTLQRLFDLIELEHVVFYSVIHYFRFPKLF